MSDYAVVIELKTQDNASKAIAALAQQAQALAEKFGKMTGGSGVAQMQKDAEALASRLAATGHAAGSAGKQMTGAFGEASAASGGLLDSIKSLVTAIGGLYIVNKVREAFTSFIGQGVEFNSTMEDSKLAIAGMIQTFTRVDGAAVSFARAAKEAEEQQKLLRMAALETAFDFTPLLNTYQILFPAAVQSGMKVSKGELVQFTQLVAQVAGAQKKSVEEMGSQMAMALQGTVHMEGTIGPLLRSMGVTSEVINSWKAAGTVFQNMMALFKPMADLAPMVAQTWSAAFSNMKDAASNLAGAGTGGIFATLKKEVLEFTNSLLTIRDGNFVFNEKLLGPLKEFGEGLGALAQKARPLLEQVVQLVVNLAKALVSATGGPGGAFLVVLTGFLKVLNPLIEKFGAMAIQVWAVSKAWGAVELALRGGAALKGLFTMVEVGDVATKTMVRLPQVVLSVQTAWGALTATVTTWASTAAAAITATTASMALFSAGMAAIVIGLGAVAVKWAEWRDEVNKAEGSNAGMKSQYLADLERLEKKFPAVAADAAALRAEIDKIDPKDSYFGTANTEKLQRYGDAVNKLQRSVQSLEKGAPKSLEGIVKPGDPQKLAQYAEELDKIQGQMRALGQSGYTAKVTELITANAAAVAKLKIEQAQAVAPSEKDSLGAQIKAQGALLTAQLAAAKREMDDANKARLIQLQKQADDIAQLTLEGGAKEVAAILSNSRAEISAKEEELRRVIATDQKSVEYRNLLAQQISLLHGKQAAEIDAWGVKLGKKYDDLTNQLAQQAAMSPEKIFEARTAEISRGFEKMTRDIGSDLAGVMELFSQAAESLAQNPLDPATVNRLVALQGLYNQIVGVLGQIPAASGTQLEQAALDAREKTAEITGDWQAVAEVIKVRVQQGALSARNALKQTGEAMIQFGQSAKEGILGQLAVITAKLPTTAENAAQATAEIWQSMGNAFTDGFYNVLSGRLSSLKDVFKNLWDSVLRTFSQFLSNLLQKWIATQTQMSESSPEFVGPSSNLSGNGRSGAFGGNGGAFGIGGTGLGGVVAGGAVGYGAGSAVGGLSGAPGFSTGAAVGGVVAGVGIAAYAAALASAVGSAAAGAAIGSVIPIVGTIIGAVIGGLIGVLAAPNTEAHVTGTVQQEIQKRGGAIQKSVESIYSGLVDVIVTGAPEQAAKITADYRAALAKAMASTRYDIAAGSSEDIQKNWEWLVNSLVPKMALQAAFGQVGMGLPHGNRDAAGGRGGFDWWSSGMDKDGNWIASRLYDPEAPIPKMLAGLGFTGKKIEELSRELANTDDPKVFLEKLKGLVGVVVGINDLQKQLSRTRQEVFAELDKGFMTQFTAARDQLITGFQNLGLYSGDEQVKKAQELIASTQQWYEQGLQYISQLRGAMRNLLDAIDKQLQGISDATKTWGQLMDDARKRANDAFKAIGDWGDETKPEEMQKNAQAAMEAIAQIVSGLQAVQQAARSAMQAVNAQVESMRTWNRSFSEQMATAKATFAAASEGLKKPGLSPEDISKLSNDALNAVRTLFDGFVAIVRAAEQEISAIEAQVAEMRNFGKTPDWLMADATRSASAGMARLGQSGLTPEEITRIGGEVREAVKTLYEGFKAVVEAAKAAKEQIAGLVQSMRDWMKGPEWLLGDAKSNALWAGNELAKPGLSGDQVTFWANKAIENVKRIFDALMAKINALREAMAQIDTILAGLSTRIAQALGETPDQALARLGATARGSAGKITATSSAEDIKKYSSEAIAAASQILDALIERLKRLAQLDKDLKDLGVKFGTAWADAIQEQMDASNPIAAYERAASGLQNKVKDAALLSGDAQVSAIEDVRAAALEMYQQQKQLLAAIAKNAADLKKSIESQIWEIQYGEMTPQGQAGAVQERIQALRQQLATASSPEVARQITDEIQSLVTRYLGLFGKDDPNRADAVKWSTDLLRDVEQLGLDTYARMQKQIEDANKLVQEALKEAGGLVTGAMKSTAAEIDNWRGFLEQMRGNLKAVEGTIGTEIETWANFLEGLQGPLNTAINWASGQITAWANALDGVRAPLETAVNWASFQIQAWANSLAGINFPLQAHVNAAAAEIGQWTAALTALRTKIEIDFTTLIDNVLAELKPLGDELGRAKTLFTDLNDPVLPGVTSSANGASLAMDGVGRAAGRLQTAFDDLAKAMGAPPAPDQASSRSAPTQKSDSNAVLRAIRLAPRLTYSQVGA